MNAELETLPLATVDAARDMAQRYELPTDANTLLALCMMYREGCIETLRYMSQEVDTL